MSTLPRPRPHKSDSTVTNKEPRQSGAAAMPTKHKKSKRLSWTLGRKKARDEPYVADGSGASLWSMVAYA